MSWFDFAIITASVALTMLACRVIPVFALKGRTLPSNAVRLLNLIPPAAFAALVANDLIVLDSWATGTLAGDDPVDFRGARVRGRLQDEVARLVHRRGRRLLRAAHAHMRRLGLANLSH